MEQPTPEQIRGLDEELRALKARFGKAMKITKAGVTTTTTPTPTRGTGADANASSSAPPSSPSSPFPLTLTISVPAPPSAQLYDIEALELVLTAHASAALRPTPPADAVVPSLGPGLGPAPLPLATRLAGGALLARRWRDDVRFNTSSSSAGGPLGALILAARSAFADVVQSAPQALEPYEAVDERGLTVRRVALVETAAAGEETAEAEAAAAAAAAEATAAAAKVAAKAAAETAATIKAAAPPPPKPTREAADAAVASAAASSAAAVHRALLAREVEALRKRFGPALELEQEGQGGGSTEPQPPKQQQQQRRLFRLSLSPTDPEWGDRGPLRLALSVAADAYPSADSVRVAALAHPPRLPASQAAVLTALAADEARQSGWQAGLLRAVLRRLENYAGCALREAEEQEAERREARRLQREQEQAEKREERQERQEGEGGDDDEGHLSDDGYGSGLEEGRSSRSGDGGDEDEDDEEEEEEEEEDRDEVALPGAAGNNASSSSSSSGSFSLLVPSLELDNVGVAELLNPVVEVSCGRCGRAAALALEQQQQQQGGGDNSAVVFRPPKPVACEGCHLPLWCELRPRALHAGNNDLGALGTTNAAASSSFSRSSNSTSISCVPRDLLPSTFAAQCGACGTVLALRKVQVGARSERACSSCHRPVVLLLPAVAFVPRSSVSFAAGRGGSSGRAAGGGGPSSSSAQLTAHGNKPPPHIHLFAAAAALPTGVPLPDNGACRHYRHSYRWLRFPCCGRRFPCDLCHEEMMGDEFHEVRWASRMTCGFCSAEQSVARKCAVCGKGLAATGSRPSGDPTTRHWEGGRGCRDKRMLDRRDAAKYRGSRMKTKSNKDSRVGQKATGGTGGG